MVLVTGGTGLVGAHLLLHLIENEESVRAIYRNPENIQKTKALFLLYKKEALFEKMRRGRDLNSRGDFSPARFRVVCLRPLSHPSKLQNKE